MDNTMGEAWREWAKNNKPQNEEAFYKCFIYAWSAAATKYLSTAPRLNWLEKAWDEAQQAAWSEKNVRVSDKWVGLTNEEAWKCWDWEDFQGTWKSIEAKLKEKNT